MCDLRPFAKRPPGEEPLQALRTAFHLSLERLRNGAAGDARVGGEGMVAAFDQYAEQLGPALAGHWTTPAGTDPA